MAAKPLRAILYLRVSTDEQAKSGAGIGAQREACRAHAERLGLRVVSSHADEGISGAAPFKDRPGLRAALAEMVAGDVLLVARRDRLGRDPMVVGEIEATAAANGGRVQSAAGEGTEDDSSTSIMIRRFIDAISENVRLVIKERTRAALAVRRAQGRRSGQVPYGERLSGDGPASKSGRPTSVVADGRDLEALALIAELDRDGWSLRAIAAELTDRGFPPKNGGLRWSPSTVHDLAGRMRAAAAVIPPYEA